MHRTIAHFLFGVVSLALLIGGVRAGAAPAVGNPTGTTYGVSGRNYGDDGGGGNDFGFGLLYESEYAEPDWDLTANQQLDGTGASVTLTFDGVEEIVNGLAFGESYQVWNPANHPIVTGHNHGAGIPSNAPVPIPFWNRPAHLVEFSVRDTAGDFNSGGGVNRDVFTSSILRVDGITPEATTPNGGTAVPMFSGDRQPRQQPFPFQEAGTGLYFYFEKNGAPANPVGDLIIPYEVLQGAHPTNPGQQAYFWIQSVGEYASYSDFNQEINGFLFEHFDKGTTHEISPGTFSFNSDTERDFLFGSNWIVWASALGFSDPFSDFDTIVIGMIYTMIAEGDGNTDGRVDGLDYLRWAANYNQTVVNVPLEQTDGSFAPISPAPSLDFNRFYGDYNSDGFTDGLDYLLWASNYGFVGDGSDTLAATVPEPIGFAIATLGLTALCCRRQKRS